MRRCGALSFSLLAIGWVACADSADLETKTAALETKPAAAIGPSWEDQIAPDLLSTMRHQEALQPAATAIYEEYMRSPTSGFAGLAFEGDGLSLYYKGPLTPGMTAALAQARVVGDVKVVAAAFSAAELEADGMAIEAAAGPDGSDIQTIGYRYDGAGLEVERTPPDVVARDAADRARSGKPALRSADEVIGALALAAPVEISVATGVIQTMAGRLDDTPPWNGGGFWQAVRNGQYLPGTCTTGFGVIASGRSWILSAAHCARIGDIGFDGEGSGFRMGPMAVVVSSYDLLLIDTSGWYQIFNGNNFSPNTKNVNSWGYHVVNELLCSSGVHSGQICGLKTNGSHDVIEDGHVVHGLIKTTQIEGNIAVRPGDSGGPVYAFSGSGVRAKGIISAGSNSTMYFQDWADVIRLFGAYPRTN
jgi:hypothetical protein